MITFFQYALVGIAGYLSGVIINWIVEWFYLRRQFLEESFENAIRSVGVVKYLVWPFQVKNGLANHKIRVLVIEILFIFVAVWLWYSPPDKVAFWWGFPVLAYFAVVAVMDIEYRVVLHPISYFGAILGLIVGMYRQGFVITLVGGLVGFVAMYLFYKLGEFFMRLVNRRRAEAIEEVALGFGDVNISGVVGLFLGWPPVILGLFFAIFAGGIFSIIFVLISIGIKRFRAFAALPYAPFLILGAITVLFFPEEVATWIAPLSNSEVFLHLPFL